MSLSHGYAVYTVKTKTGSRVIIRKHQLPKVCFTVNRDGANETEVVATFDTFTAALVHATAL